MATSYLAIQYIGGLPEKRDNIIPQSGRIWKGKYASLRVPESEADKYVLGHPDEFRLLHPLFLLSPSAEALSTDDQIYAMLSITANLDLNAAEELLLAVQARLKELAGFGGSTDVSPADRPRFSERRKALADTIRAMDRDDKTHYTDQGRPRVSVVAELSGLKDVSSAEISEVVRQMKATEAAT